MKILVTGGTGYIGSHTCIELINAGYEPIVIDNFSNSSPITLEKIEKLSSKKIKLYEGDVRCESLLSRIFTEESIHAVMHFAGFKSVKDSMTNPTLYYDNNLQSSISLIKTMRHFKCRRLVFSSSATVYGEAKEFPIKENSPLLPNNPYGYSKLVIEKILDDIFKAEENWHIAILRYFNPVGAHKSGLIGETTSNKTDNLLPKISQVAIGKIKKLSVFGNDFSTYDGTGIRDYIHVVDLARGHIKALQILNYQPNIIKANLGTGIGYSVLDIIKTFEKVSGKKIPYKISARRSGDIGICYANVDYAYKILGWRAEYDLYQMCNDIWRWQKLNINEFSKYS